MAKHVDYYLSLNSPWAYLASKRFEAIARKHGADVTSISARCSRRRVGSRCPSGRRNANVTG